MIAKSSNKPEKQFLIWILPFVFSFLFLIPFTGFAQSTTVTGKITGTDGAGIAGVTVQEKGTSKGTATNTDGSFSLSVSKPMASVVISSLGYQAQTIALNGRTNVSVTLQGSNAKELEQVVVIGYGTANKRDLTGSIVKIAGKEVADKPNTNPIASLQSKVAGLSVVNNGTPGAAPDIRIRGTVSIGQVHPLYVVDGVFEDNIDYINPYDIESIEILKDPSSLAIFGVKGATGVIAITTKRAKAGQTVVNFNTFYGFKKLVNKIKLASADQFKTLFAEENANNGITDTFNYTGLTANTDWIDAVTRTAKTSTSNLSISQSTDKNKFYLGLGYTYDEGIIRHEKLERMQFNFNDELKLNKAITIGVNVNGSRKQNPYDATAVLDQARKVVPMVSARTKQFRIQNPYGADSINANLYSGLNTSLQSAGVINPVLQLENTWNTSVNIEYRTVGSIYAEINFLKYFTFRSTFYADMSTVNNRQYSPLYDAYNPVDNTPYLYNNSTSLLEKDNTYRKFQQDHILTFRKGFGDHNLTLTAGFTTYYFGNFNRQVLVKQGTGAGDLPIPNDPRFWYVNSGFGVVDPTIDPYKTNSAQNEYTTASGLARALYNYKGKYFFNASLRNDASSQIPTKNRNQQFWALGGAWELTKENFMANQRLFDYVKIKGSIGVLGNQSASYLDGTPINYPFYPNLNTGVNAVFGTNVYAASTPAYKANPDLKWENVAAQEIGVELNAFQNRLHLEANYFNKTTKNLMTYVDRSILGLPNELINGGSIRNWGEELSASWNQNFSKDLSLNISGNITFLKNKVLSLSPDIPNGVLDVTSQNNGEAISETKPGYPIGYFKGYVVTGVFQSYNDILKSPSQANLGGNIIRPGDLKFKDINGDGVIDAKDRTFIGNPTPKFTYGTSISLNYKGFNLSLDLGGVYGNEVYRVWGSLESPFQRVNYPEFKINRWHGPGTSNWDPILSQADRSNYVGSTYNIEDGSYFRIRNAQLGYNFSTSTLSRMKIKNLRLFVNGQNLITWKNNSGYTAEFGGNATSFGYDSAGGAIPSITTFGLNATF
ncbi:MAG: SusC/RagA family TonB-linked outer membrane protein [Bacteroidota bacterium]|nr:SusC/RagA family TonB-linked outer membrane protein [Bacteroidota bacterium]